MNNCSTYNCTFLWYIVSYFMNYGKTLIVQIKCKKQEEIIAYCTMNN